MVVQSAEGLAKIDKLTPCRYGAPTVLVVAFNKDSVFTYPGGKHSSGAEDAAIVATHLMLAATNARGRIAAGQLLRPRSCCQSAWPAGE